MPAKHLYLLDFSQQATQNGISDLYSFSGAVHSTLRRGRFDGHMKPARRDLKKELRAATIVRGSGASLPAGFVLPLLLSCAIVSLFFAPTVRAQAGSRPWRVGAADRFQPVIDYLNSQLPDQHFEMYRVPHGDLVGAGRRQEMDFVLAAPSYFVVVDVGVGVTPIATLRERIRPGVYTNFLGGAIFCRADKTSIHSIRDLRGKRFAAVDELAVGGWIAAGRELCAEGMDLTRDLTVRFMYSPEAVVDAVKTGAADAGVVTTGTIEDLLSAGEIKPGEFRVLPPRDAYPEAVGLPLMYSTRFYPQVAFAALPHVPEPLMRRIAIALLRLPEDGEVAEKTGSGGWSLPVGYQSVHRAMQEMRVGPYSNIGKISLGSAIRQNWEKVLAVLLCLVSVMAILVLRAGWLNRKLSHSQRALQDEFELHRIAQERRHESEVRFRSIFDNSAVGIYLTSPEGKIIESNLAFQLMSGYSHEELEDLDVATISNPDDLAMEQEPLKELLAGIQNSYELDKRFLRKGGGVVWAHFTGSVIRNVQGALVLGIGMAVEITQRKQAEEEREHLIADLRAALTDIHTLSGLLPICSHCKKIRDDQGYWQQVEVFMQEHAQVQFSHGICPACLKKNYPEYSEEAALPSETDSLD